MTNRFYGTNFTRLSKEENNSLGDQELSIFKIYFTWDKMYLDCCSNLVTCGILMVNKGAILAVLKDDRLLISGSKVGVIKSRNTRTSEELNVKLNCQLRKKILLYENCCLIREKETVTVSKKPKFYSPDKGITEKLRQ